MLLSCLRNLTPCLGELTPGLGEFFGQRLESAFRRGKIVGGRSCHDYTRLPYNLPVQVRAGFLAPASQRGCRECYAIWRIDGMSSQGASYSPRADRLPL